MNNVILTYVLKEPDRNLIIIFKGVKRRIKMKYFITIKCFKKQYIKIYEVRDCFLIIWKLSM